MRAIPQAAFDLVREQEDTITFAYDDAHWPPKPAAPGDKIDGTLTAGCGHTGPDVVIGMEVGPELIQSWLQKDLGHAAERIFERIGDIIDQLTENQWAALLDFVFNLGANPSWTIWKRLKAKQFDQIPLELQKFVNIRKGGQLVKSKDLVNRRNAEVALWASGEPGTDDSHVSSTVARLPDTTPPTASDPTKPTRSKVLISGIAGTVTAAPAVCDDVIHNLSKYAEHSDYVAHGITILATVGAVCVGLTLLFAYFKNKEARN